MTVQELIEELQALDPQTEVRLMSQPAWPFEYSISGIFSPDASDRCTECGLSLDDVAHGADGDHDSEGGFQPSDYNGEPHVGPVVYLLEGQQLAYGTKDAWN